MDVYIVCPGEIVAYNHTRYNCNKHVSRRDGTRPESGTDPAVNSRSSSPRRGYFASATHTAPLFSYRSTPVETKGAPIAPALISSHSGALAPVPATCLARRRSQRRMDPLTEGQKDCHFVPPPLCSRGTNEEPSPGFGFSSGKCTRRAKLGLLSLRLQLQSEEEDRKGWRELGCKVFGGGVRIKASTSPRANLLGLNLHRD